MKPPSEMTERGWAAQDRADMVMGCLCTTALFVGIIGTILSWVQACRV